MFEFRLTKARLVLFGFREGVRGALSLVKAPDFYDGLDWQIHRQIGLSGTWNVQYITEQDLVEFGPRAYLCRQIEWADTDIGIGFVSIRDFEIALNVFLSPADLAGHGTSVYDQWSQAIRDAVEDIGVETVLRLNVGVCTEAEIAAFRDGLWLGTRDIELEIRPRTFA